MLVGPSVVLLVCPHDEILLMWKTGYVAIASRRGEGRGNQLMLKTGYVEIASRLVTVACSCFLPISLSMFKDKFEKMADTTFSKSICDELIGVRLGRASDSV
jgi:hypothetical protein